MKNKQVPSKNKTIPCASFKRFPIVGIGASAGGLEAYESFFKAMPEDSGMAFVLISHLDPTHISILPELIGKQTQMKVHQIQDGQKLLPNQVYVIPPNKILNILNGILYLLELPLSRGLNLPIDIFFRSLAQDQGANAIGIILSGTGTDGTLGIKEIKGEMGMVMVQDERTAKYDGMPRSAISTGLADYILPVDKLPAQLINYVRHITIQPQTSFTADENKFQKALQKIFILLRSQTRHDFSHYKKNTIYRRIERRMHVHQIDEIKDYVKYLQNNEKEVHTLFKDLLIGVTSFFRDQEAFEILKHQFLTALLKNTPQNQKVRIWVAGCSSGEEAYSMAILMQESMKTMGRHFEVQIFGTDIDEDAINTARAGLYPSSISADISPERLTRYFTREDNHYRIHKSIREMVVFALQNLIKDPPFTKLDLLCCRNLLIYLESELQKKLLPVFHYSLKEKGILFLGTSESIGQTTELFKMEDKKWKIFTRQPYSPVAHPMLDFPVLPAPDKTVKTTPSMEKSFPEINHLMMVESILEQSNAPPCAIIDDKDNIVYIHGRTGRYLEPAIGKASVNILDMARPGLKVVLNATLRMVHKSKQPMVHKGVEIQENKGFIQVDLGVKPLQEYGAMNGLIMVSFMESTAMQEKKISPKPKKNAVLAKLEQELQYTRENLQSTIEELETSNEELKSTNEEMQSTNEELQSTNEELETSKEELQSLNEESATVNVELQSRIDDLSKINDDMKNLLDSTQIATIFLDIDLGIRRFTQKATELIPLNHTDIGRPIHHFATELKDIKLVEYARRVLDTLAIIEEEVVSQNNRIFKIRLLPYRTIQNVIDGVVITLDDITRMKKIENQLRHAAAMLTENMDAMTLQKFDGKILAWNKGAQNLYGYTEEEALKMNIFDTIPEGNKQETLTFIHQLEKGKQIAPFKTQRKSKDGRILDILLTATLFKDGSGKPEGIATTERDLTLFRED